MDEKGFYYKGLFYHKDATSSYYICRKCGRSSLEMMPAKLKHIPNMAELKSHKFSHVIHELLECPCGEVNSWFDLKEIKTLIRDQLQESQVTEQAEQQPAKTRGIRSRGLENG